MRPTEIYLGELGPYLLLLFIIIGVLFFSYSIWRRIRLLSKAKRENRFSRILERIKLVIVYVFFQRKMFKDTLPGWMHAFIFWGFLTMLIRAITLYGMGFSYGFHLPLLGNSTIGHLYHILKDIFVVLVILAVLFALYRRLFVKPERLSLSTEAVAILFLILIIMVTDVLFDGSVAKFNIANNQATLGGFLFSVSGLERLSAGYLWSIQAVSYWGHTLTILVFLNLLPYSKHFHILTAIPNVFFSSLTPKGGRLPLIDFKDETAESYGVSKIEEFTWKQCLDLYTCTECGRCTVNCPAHISGKPLHPKELTIALRDHLYEEEAFLIRKRNDRKRELINDVVVEETLWSCTTCRNCEEECPVFIEYIDKIIEMRRYLVMMESRFPSELKRVMRGLETNSNPWGIGRDRRIDWIEGESNIWKDSEEYEYLLFVGCAGSFDDRIKKVSKSFMKILDTAGINYGLLGVDEACCGDPARRLGNEYLYQMIAKDNIEKFNAKGVKKILTFCPHCYNTIKNEYPQLGGNFEVTHHSQFIDKLIEGDRISLIQEYKKEVVFHDSCYLGRFNGIYDAPRDVLKAVKGVKLIETDRKREKGLCCGAGGGRFWLEEKTGKRMNEIRLGELLDTTCRTIGVSCPFCMVMLEDAVKNQNLEESVDIKDISEIVIKTLLEG